MEGARVPTLNLTPRAVAAIKAGDRADHCDVVVPGLSLRVSARGVKTWSVLYRFNGRNRRLTLGRFPEVSVASARERAREVRAEAALGTDPAGEKQAERERFANTVSALVTEYERIASRRRAWTEERRILHAEILPAWRNRLVADITRRDVRQLVERKAESAPVMANRLLAEISRLFNFALDREWIDANPAHRMTPPTQEQSRDRVLSANELRELWTALGETHAVNEKGEALNRLSPVLNLAFRTMLLTAQRSGEVCRMRWADVDLETAWWTLPGSATKNGADHRVPLTDVALEIIASQLQHAKADAVFVFSTQTSAPHARPERVPTDRRTNIADRAKKAASHLSKGLSFSFRAHDLRRTVASGMAEAGISRDHIAQVLNHRSVTRASVTAIYDRYNYDREKRAALEAWARHLRSIEGGVSGSARVLKMQRR